jgi:TolB-like protein/tRNA A-37 threonylcarbamoyl transferase component Bud32/protein involved in temperature-dependent protein secretion
MTAPAPPRACPACHTPLPEAAHFCLNCGTATPTEPGVPPRTAATDVTEIARVRKALSSEYAIERVLGEGGMATVYLATDLKHRRQVAVKVMRPELAATLGAERFLREVEIAAQLSHPHILPVHDSGAADGVLYYVMPYVEGESLHERIQRETSLPVDEALRLTREVAEALAYAHGRKIIHRDIKPANIMLSAGHALVADFGIARAVGAGGGAAITKTGLSVGTPQYMSPEQASGSAGVDARSDIFAVGCVLYEMLAGEPPFTGPTPQAIVIRSMTEAPRPLSATRDGISPAIEAVVTRALAKNPADRWQSAADFASALGSAHDQLRLGPLSGARTPVPQAAHVQGPSPAKVWGLFGVIGALALALVYGLVQRWGLPVWALGLAVLLLAIGAVVLLLTGKAEARRAAGQSVGGLAARLTWKNATLGGLGALGLWAVIATILVFRGPGGAAGGGLVRLAVLPFENRGDPADNYFVDGITDQVRGKLMSVAGFQVTARTSSDQYKASTKPPQQIGKELGVDYLLTSTVVWVKGTGTGKGRVQVVPELIAVKTGAGAWQQSFDAELTDIFQVQGNIATQVAGALNVALAPKEKQELAERPTKNLGAYDLFLKGRAVIGNAPANLRQAAGYYEQAVTLDSTFTEAWARLGTALTQLYFNGTPTPQVAERARAAVERAKALDPNGVIPLAASSRFHYLVENNLAAAEADAQAAIRLAPNDVDALRLASQTEQILGRWPESLARLETARRLDPRSLPVLRTLSYTLTVLRKYPEAEAVVREALAQAPTDLNSAEGLVFIHLMQGDLAAARGDIRALPAEVSRPTLVSYFALYQDIYWVLEEEDQKLVLRLTPSAFDDDRGVWATTLMQLAALRGDKARARALADTAVAEYDKQLRGVPNDPQRNIFRGLALAILGRKAEAIQAAERGVSFAPLSADQTNGAYNEHQLARVYIVTGEYEKALDKLEALVKIPYVLTPGYLRIDPNFAPLKGNPRFEKLLRE